MPISRPMASSTSPHDTANALAPKKAGARNAITASRAEHGTSGASRIVSNRPRRDSMTRVPITAGTLQPNPRNSGRNDFPCSPMTCITLSIT